MGVDNRFSELGRFVHPQVPAVAAAERVTAHRVATAQDCVLAGLALFLLFRGHFTLRGRQEGVAVEPEDRCGHVTIDVGAGRDQSALVALSGERQQHTSFDHGEIPGAELCPVIGHQSEAQGGRENLDWLTPTS
jgi:hypothetical protein